MFDYFKQYHTFACSLLDRLAILTERDEGITIHLRGVEHLERIRDQGVGGILVGSHLGGFDILRMIGRTRGGYRVKAVMFGDATPQIVRIFQEINPSLHEDIITVPGPAAILGLWPDVNKGLMIGLLGDRLMPGERTLSCSFLANLPCSQQPRPTLPIFLKSLFFSSSVSSVAGVTMTLFSNRYHLIQVDQGTNASTELSGSPNNMPEI